MLVLLLIYTLVQSGLGDAVPTPPIELRDLGSGGEPIQTRSLWNIITSCLSTIFLCTWVSLHPNISSTPEKPGLGRFEKWIRKPLVEFLTYKLPLFFWALLVPEYILAWAIRQYIMAGKVQRKVPGWTRAHGFFLLMGGFQLFEHSEQPAELGSGKNDYLIRDVGSFVRILEFKDVLQHELETVIPFTTEKEIKDRGKSDGISKFIVLLQTSWFIIQCIARGIKHLPLTELEVVTLAYAMLNLFVYIFWWDKPRDVGCPIRVYESLTVSHTADEWYPGVGGIMERAFIYIVGFQDRYVTLSHEQKVPIFWSGGVKDSDSGVNTSMIASLGPSILGIAFGGIHYIAWSYIFPSHAEIVLWRVSCVAMTVVPLFSTLLCITAVTGDLNNEDGTGFALVVILMLLLGLSAWLYIVARIATIVMAFTTLRSLPSDAFTVVDWTTFIPHI